MKDHYDTRKKTYLIERPTAKRGKRFLFERNGQFGWGAKTIATRFRGAVDAKRAAALVALAFGRSDVRLVHA